MPPTAERLTPSLPESTTPEPMLLQRSRRSKCCQRAWH
ncbi:hypothetical protein AVDCRST_MAG94-5094 [uncultured Leptolyngbya sp.]|uniref:Uncharacterized protein n=1 Tax=uncultured Leptolyngbya sp. TaxID=332963 RepID=A0A6J4NDV3_9CYAN|nr:hypothetical protein AVDCRST_MAG94-5094 [uncultured Leptolyngbya sp.]